MHIKKDTFDGKSMYVVTYPRTYGVCRLDFVSVDPGQFMLFFGTYEVWMHDHAISAIRQMEGM